MSIASFLSSAYQATMGYASRAHSALTSINPTSVENFLTGAGAAARANSDNILGAMNDFGEVMGRGLVGGLADAEQGAVNAALRSSLEAGYDANNLRSALDTAAGRGLTDIEYGNITKARDYFLSSQREGNYGTRGSFEDMARNLNDTGELFSGYSRAGQNRPISALTELFSLEDKTIGQEVGMLAGAGLLGGVVNYAAGGEFESGAGVGALAAVGLRGAGRMVQNSMGDIETSMMKRLLGETEYGKLTAKDPVAAQAQETVKSKYGGKNMVHLYADQPNLKLSDLGIDPTPYTSKGIDASSTLDDVAKKLDPAEVRKFAGIRVDSLTNDPILTQAVAAQPGQSVRNQALNAIGKMTPDEVKGRGIGASYTQKMLTSKDKGNMGANMRVMTISGAALAGVSFTGRRNDHSSGFNKNRGNKI